MTGMRMSVTPPACSAREPGELVISYRTEPDGYVTVLRADRVICISDKLYNLIRDGWSPFAQLVRRHPGDLGILKIRGLDGLVVYEITGHCGLPAHAYIAEMPD